MIRILIAFLFTCACLNLQAQVNIIQTIAGCDSVGFSGDGGPATIAKLNVPVGICIDKFDNIYISDVFNQAIRKVVLSTGIITTIAGKDSSGFSGDGGKATDAKLFDPEGIFADAYGNIYIADGGSNRIREITVATGIITTIAGSGAIGVGAGGDSGDGGPATDAQMNVPVGLCLDKAGDIYITDYSNDKVRRVDAITHIITTFAGIGGPAGYTGGHVGYTGDGGPATAAQFSGVAECFADSAGNVFICDQWNHAIRKVDASTGIITTIAGNGTAGYTGDGGLAKYATLNQPVGIFVDKNENIFISEYGDGVIRKIDGATGIISTIAGTGTRGFSGDGGPATAAELACSDVFLDSNGIIYIADIDNNRVRVVYNDKLGVPALPGQQYTQQYSLHPNPSDGNITLVQSVPDMLPVRAEIWNALGDVIYEDNILFTGGIDQLHVKNAVSGLYLLQLTDEKNQIFRLKFIINH